MPGALLDQAGAAGRRTFQEGFADRAYRGDRLVPRDEPGALLEDVDAIAAQAVALATQGRLRLRARRQSGCGRRGPSRTAGARGGWDRAGGPVVSRQPVVADPVREALGDGRPVVALESTIFTHGLPRPRNLEVALAAEESLRAIGVVPATIGVLRGVPTVGLTADQIRELGADDDVIKVSLRDLPIAAAKRRSGGTTVAGTAFLAARAGIAVFATGGLGGVHRGASETFDESADLPVLAQTPILMVSAGVKSILDVGASLERLETLSITLVGYRTTRFPGFYLADSGFAIDYAVDEPRRGRRPGAGPRRPRRARSRSWSPTRCRPSTSWTPPSTTGCWARPWPRWTRQGSAATTPRRTSSTTSSARPGAAASTSTWRSTRTTWRWPARSPAPWLR